MSRWPDADTWASLPCLLTVSSQPGSLPSSTYRPKCLSSRASLPGSSPTSPGSTSGVSSPTAQPSCRICRYASYSKIPAVTARAWLRDLMPQLPPGFVQQHSSRDGQVQGLRCAGHGDPKLQVTGGQQLVRQAGALATEQDRERHRQGCLPQ